MLLFGLLAASLMMQAYLCSAVAQETPPTIDSRKMTFLNQMQTRLAEYNATGDWTKKIFPADESLLQSAESPVYIEVYVSDVKDTTQNSTDIQSNEAAAVFLVYLPTERAIEQLSAIPHTYFYVSRFSPSICLTVEKQVLQQVAEVPSVYCIRIIPSASELSGGFSLVNSSDSGSTFDMVWIVLLLTVACVALIAIAWTGKKRTHRTLP